MFAQQVEDSKIWKEKKRFKMVKEGSDGHGCSKCRQKFSRQGNPSETKYKDKRVTNPRRLWNNEYCRPICPRRGKKHEGRCLAGEDCFYGCGDSEHMMRDFIKAKESVRE